MSALAHVVGLATRSPSRRNSSRHDRFAAGGLCVVLGPSSGKHRSVGLLWQLTPAPWLVLGEHALNPLHYSGGPSKALGWAAIQLGSAPFNPKHCRSRAGIAAASCRSAVNVGLALAWAASDNKSIHTDTQVHRAAQRRLCLGAGDFQRYRSKT